MLGLPQSRKGDRDHRKLKGRDHARSRRRSDGSRSTPVSMPRPRSNATALRDQSLQLAEAPWPARSSNPVTKVVEIARVAPLTRLGTATMHKVNRAIATSAGGVALATKSQRTGVCPVASAAAATPSEISRCHGLWLTAVTEVDGVASAVRSLKASGHPTISKFRCEEPWAHHRILARRGDASWTIG
jgi:hypothetical protein